MKLVARLASAFVLVAPAVAVACPGAETTCCSTGFGGYVAALGVGLLAGLGSVKLEALFKRRD